MARGGQNWGWGLTALESDESHNKHSLNNDKSAYDCKTQRRPQGLQGDKPECSEVNVHAQYQGQSNRNIRQRTNTERDPNADFME